MMAAPYRILLVDDEVATLQYYAALLEKLGHIVKTRDRALGTAPVIIRERPDFVFLDVEMPALSGHEIIRVLRRRTGEHRTRFVLLSSKSEEELKRLAQDCGADAYISKNAGREALLRRIAEVLSLDR